ncbi:hypothetical protein Q1695_001714 [Nippostrongylus brasiliensis]|nr:hypothetical protein Q1695_001714 [Nippostrongylus brasiliensis]
MTQERSKSTQACILVTALILMAIAFALSAAGLLNPSWQVVDIREFRAEHHHGLWLDCARAERYLIGKEFSNGQSLHCTYKFDYAAEQAIDESIDVDRKNAVGESEHHRFFAWHKAVLGCIVVSLLLASLALCCGLCAPCSGGCAVIFTIFVLLSLFMAVIGDGIFFFAAHRVDNRFVQGLLQCFKYGAFDTCTHQHGVVA